MNTEVIFNADNEAKQIYVMQVFPVDVTVLWDHFTNAELLDLWWAPKPWTCETITLNFQEEGVWQYAMVGPENERHHAAATYHEINLHRSFDWTDYFTNEHGQEDRRFPSVKWLFGFTGVENGTKLTINIHFNDVAEMNQMLEMGFEQGFRQALSQLSKILSEKGLHQ
ncbi:glutathione S-transferase [Chryseobacterium sp. 6424]|uniref:SRPBCC family protein n=1 Tax=Chryseobacterium sp. 6424 TaxID=2039166 RepID=UPI000EFD7C19|nr:SRPBCC domain-containing protein [Chryseobacterium sp. 6424]AYO58635.1 glutathione S-transferase [Chryseobacterium sp. 6424]